MLAPALDQSSYVDFLIQFGFKPLDVRKLTESTDDQVGWDDQRTEIRDSPIQGVGLFAKKRILKGERFIGRTKDLKRTPAGRYTNHAAQPNCTIRAEGGELVMVADRDLDVGTEMTVDYVATLQVNFRVTPGEGTA